MLRKSYRSRCVNPRPTWDNLIPSQHTYVEAMPARMVMGEPRLLPKAPRSGLCSGAACPQFGHLTGTHGLVAQHLR
jgi:hypothetical protein